MFVKIKKYWLVWKKTAQAAFQITFVNRNTNLLFLIGKILRLSMSLLFLFLIKQNIQTFAGYTTDQMIVFFLTYQFVDVFAQVLYRGVYIFSNLMCNGDFDFHLAQPINPLFRALTGRPDINDAIFIIPTIFISIFIVLNLNLVITFSGLLLYLILLINSFIIATAMHILILAIGVITIEVDGVVWIYRDFMRLGQFPVTIYMEPLRFALFFIVPVGMMVTLPAQVLLGMAPSYSLVVVSVVGILSLVFSLKFWGWSLKRYGSASS